jgi:endonuclease/exonuclease/phosphatase family metal-dependent hydrolase
MDADCTGGLACIGGTCQKARGISDVGGKDAPGTQDAGDDVDGETGRSDGGDEGRDVEVVHDGGGIDDAGSLDGETADGGAVGDGGSTDRGGTDSGAYDTGTGDTGGASDAGPPDSGIGADGGSQGDGGADETLSVLQINIQTVIANAKEIEARTGAVADLILAEKPHFVALQEVTDTTSYGNRDEVLAEAVGYEWVFEMTHDTLKEGIAVLSRWPVVWHEAVQLPHEELGGLFKRAVLGVRAASNVGEMQFFCTHLTVDSDSTKKADQAAAALEFIESHPSALPAFFAGDMNAKPDELAMRMLRGEAEHGGLKGDLVDSWLAVNGADPGFTQPSDNPTKRIDYIYLVPGTGSTAEVRSCETVFTKPVNGVMVSDHLGLLCHYTVR